jgi:low density lipoprotein-related protein 2
MKPYSLDIFEDQLYWVAKEKGEVWKQNKFGQGRKEKMVVVNPWLTQVRIFHQLRYNQSGNHQPWNKIPLLSFQNNGHSVGKG